MATLAKTLKKMATLQFDNRMYSIDLCYVVDNSTEENIPVFGIVKSIIKLNGNVYLCLKFLHTLSFCEHLHAFKIALTKYWILLIPGTEVDYKPLDLYGPIDDDNSEGFLFQ